MTNDYDAHRQPRDLDTQGVDEFGREEVHARYQQPNFRDPAERAVQRMAEAVDIRSRLATNLRASVEEAHNLATFYGNFAQTLELCLSQLETKK